jgi:heat shock protein HslJ
MYALFAFLLLPLLAGAGGPANMPPLIQPLEGTQWWVEDIGGRGVVDASHTTIAFVNEGGVSGDTGCNRYHGTYVQEGKAVSFGPMAGTRRACPEALMNQEQRFYAAMGQVVSWRIDAADRLLLVGPGQEILIRAFATDENP